MDLDIMHVSGLTDQLILDNILDVAYFLVCNERTHIGKIIKRVSLILFALNLFMHSDKIFHGVGNKNKK